MCESIPMKKTRIVETRGIASPTQNAGHCEEHKMALCVAATKQPQEMSMLSIVLNLSKRRLFRNLCNPIIKIICDSDNL